MKDCNTVRDDLKAYLDGQLPPAARLATRLHLSRCASCRKEMKAMEQIGQELREDAGKLDAGLRARILASVPQGAPPMSDSPARVSIWRGRPMIFWGAAAAAVISWFVFYPLFAQMQHAPEMAFSKMQTPAAPPTAAAGGQALSQNLAKDVALAKPAERALKSQDLDAYASISGRSNGPAAMTTRQKSLPPGTPGMMGGPPVMAGVGKSSELVASRNRGAAPAESQPPLPVERQVHKEAEITLQVDQIEARSDEVEQMVNNAGGFVVNNELSTGDDNLKSASLSTRVPVAKFDSVLSRLSKLGEVKAKHVTGEDLTERISDQEQTTRVVQDDIAATKARLHTKQDPFEHESDQENLQNLKIRIAQERGRLTYQECAKVLDIPVGTVKSRLSNAFRRLRDSLGDYILGDGSALCSDAVGERTR